MQTSLEQGKYMSPHALTRLLRNHFLTRTLVISGAIGRRSTRFHHLPSNVSFVIKIGSLIGSTLYKGTIVNVIRA